MKCSCGKTALYYVGQKFFCGEHKEAAYEAARKDSNRSFSAYGAEQFRFDTSAVGSANRGKNIDGIARRAR